MVEIIEPVVVNRHFVAALTHDEYLKLRIDVAKKGLTLKTWITQAITDKLNKTKEDKD